MKNNRGNALIMVSVALMILIILIPHLVKLVNQDARNISHLNDNSKSFHLAEVAVERGFQQLIISTQTIAQVSSGTAIAGFNFDTTYSDPSGGTYQVRLSSNTSSTLFVTGVGRSKDGGEVRGVKVQYAVTGAVDNAIAAQGAVGAGASTAIEWAPIYSLTSISAGSRAHPRFYSQGNITNHDANAGSPPNTDNVQWWSYQSNLKLPSVDLNAYKTIAQAAGATSAACGGSFYVAGDMEFKNCNGVTGTWYVTGNVTFKSGGSGGNFVHGNVIALGYIEISGSGGASGDMTVPVPPKAWKEYGNDWAFYRSEFDGAAPATYAAAVAADYSASATYRLEPNNQVLFDGFMYAGGGLQFSGSGNACIYGAAMASGAPALGSNVTFYFNPNAAAQAKTTARGVQRTMWRDVRCTWSGTGPASCQ